VVMLREAVAMQRRATFERKAGSQLLKSLIVSLPVTFYSQDKT